MAYSEFTLSDVQKLGVVISERVGVFDQILPTPISPYFAELLHRNLTLAMAISTEKARSELVVSQMLVELRIQAHEQVSFFSGIDFPIDSNQGLTGFCDFLLSLSPLQTILEAPVLAIVEAKKDDISSALGQCAASMVAARIFNERKGKQLRTIYGAVTTGNLWKFMTLNDKELQIDLVEYPINTPDKILGILLSMVNNAMCVTENVST